MTPSEAADLLRDLMEIHEVKDQSRKLTELTVTLRGLEHPLLRVWITPHGSIRVESTPHAPQMDSTEWPSRGAPAGSIMSWNIGMVWKKNAQFLLQQHGIEPDKAKTLSLKIYHEEGPTTPEKLARNFVNSAISMLNPRALQLAHEKNHWISIHRHNICLIGTQGMREVLQHNPGAWQWAMLYTKPQQDVTSPKDLMAIVQKDMAQRGVETQNLEYAARIQRRVIKSIEGSKNSVIVINIIAEAMRAWEQDFRDQPDGMATVIRTASSALGERRINIPFDLADALIQLLDPAAHKDITKSVRTATISAYRIAKIGREALLELHNTNPGIITWAMRMEHPAEELQHPGQVIKMVRKSLHEQDVDVTSWKSIARAHPSIMKVIAYPNCTSETTAIALSALGRLPEHPRLNALKKAMKVLTGRLRSERTPGIDLFFRLLLQETARKTSGNIMSDAILVRNYVEWVDAEGQAITARTWGGLQRRSQRWHQQLQQKQLETQWHTMMEKKNNTQLSWTSAVQDPVLIDGMTATPLTSEWDLYQESLAMNHCIIHYGERCAHGKSRIFSITRGSQHIASVELILEHRGWIPIQVRGFRNCAVTEEVWVAARHLAEVYNRAGVREPGETRDATV